MATPIPNNRASFTLEEVAAATRGVIHGDPALRVEGVAIDSRAVTEGALFVAIRGESQDGARYLPAAVDHGARALLVHAGSACPEGVSRIEVDDTTRALGDLAAYHRRRWGGKLVAVTGSAGKTTTKELTAGALAATSRRVLKTEGNLNNQFGVPMTLFCLGAEHDVAVLEVGTSARGEIARLGEISQPNVAVVLLAAAAHTAGIGSVLDVADEKSSLFRALSADGICIVNADDANLVSRVPHGLARLSFGRAEVADYRLLEVTLSLEGSVVRVGLPDGAERTLTLHLLGEAAALDACAALAATLSLCGTDKLDTALTGLSRVRATPGRMALSRVASGAIVLDDTYNANPRSTELGLSTLKALSSGTEGRTLAVLGDMKELGQLSATEHTRIGELAVRLGIDVLIGCGDEMTYATSRAARLSGGRLAPHPTRVVHVMDPMASIPIIRSLWRPGDVVLVKGSRSMRMERIVEALVGQREEAV